MTQPQTPSYRPKCGIYALVDPRTTCVMYVGQSIDIDHRYRQHCNPNAPNAWESNPEKYRWLTELHQAGLKPTLIVIEECNVTDLDDLEVRFVAQFRAVGQAELNIADGGNARGSSKAKRAHIDDWHMLGRRVRRARAILQEAAQDAGNIAGIKYSFQIHKLLSELDLIASDLDEVFLSRFPKLEPREFGNVFFGPARDEELDNE